MQSDMQSDDERAEQPQAATAPALPAMSAGSAPAATRAAGGVPVVETRHLRKEYRLGESRVQALSDVSLTIWPGEFVAIMGPSGSGKSTFMNLLGCLDRPSAGAYRLMGIAVERMTPDQLADVRSQRIGFVFQGFNLLSRQTALKNVQLPMIYAGLSGEAQERRARRALDLVGLGDRLNHRPTQLSGGQQQRVAIARALVNNPSLLLADEPTGNLDSHISVEIMGILQQLNARGVTIVLVTHEPDIAAYARRQVAFRDGAVIRDTSNNQPRDASAELGALAAPHVNA